MHATSRSRAEVMSYTPRTLKALVDLAASRERRELRDRLLINRAAAHGKKEELERQLAAWARMP